MIKKIRLQGLLSFEDMELELRNLNVLIGPNGSGKSNLIEALSLLQALPTDIGEPIRRGGGIGEWLSKRNPQNTTASMEVEVALPWAEQVSNVYELTIESTIGRYAITRECLHTSRPPDGYHSCISLFSFESGHGTMRGLAEDSSMRDFDQVQLGTDRQSVLHEVREPTRFPAAALLADEFSSIRLYREWSFGTGAKPRQPQPADQPVDFLLESGDNLALVVNEFKNIGISEYVEREFKRFFSPLQQFGVSIFGGQVLLNMREEALADPIAATRWSDGMIRYLCLLAILCHPNPPGIIAIAEPELGFHPDILPNLARLIKDASERTQIIITTHSAELVDQFTDEPESVVVCERDFDGATQMKRQDPKRLKKWLEDYMLGDLWRRGEIGGNPF